MNNKKAKILTIVGIVTLLLTVVSATFAYFIAQGGTSSNKNVTITTSTTDSLVFNAGDPISLVANADNFGENNTNRVGTTFASAELKANNATNNAKNHYYVYLDILKNEFTYTTEDKKGELILNITDEQGNEVTVLSLNKVSVVDNKGNTITGYDITTTEGIIKLIDKDIESTGTTFEKWNIKITFVNLSTDQNGNAGKRFNANLLVQKEQAFSDYIASLYTKDGENNLYYHDGTGDYENASMEAGDKSYRYAGGEYGITASYQSTYSKIATNSVGRTGAIIGFMCDGAESYAGVSCTDGKEYYYFLTYEEGSTKTQYKTYQEALYKAISDGYVEATPVKNYVCFGDDCSDYDNLYRIIGVFNGRVKLIKADYANKNLLGEDGDYNSESTFLKSEYSLYQGIHEEINKYYWNASTANGGTGKNNWRESRLNTINLNTNFLTNIGDKWSNKIRNSLWNVAGGSKPVFTPPTILLSIPRAKAIFNTEFGNVQTTTLGYEPYEAKVGLIYISDFMYAASPSCWNLFGYHRVNNSSDYRSTTEENWMNIRFGVTWTISRTIDNNSKVYYISSNGGVLVHTQSSQKFSDYSYAVRPTFYLNSNVTYVGGKGTETDPYRIN